MQRTRNDLHSDESTDSALWQRVTRLYPVARSLTGDGVRATLALIAEELPIDTHEVATGTDVLDWTVPDEWNLRRATLVAPDGRMVIDSAHHPLHVVGYSEPIDRTMSLDELRPHLHSLADRPTAIPYRTAYYNRTWGLCLRHHDLEALAPGNYRVVIDATLAPGALSYGELVIPGSTDREILISTHVCHPQMANDNASGIAASVELGLRLRARTMRHTVRLLFIPGSLGAICWLAANRDVTARIDAGLVITGLGDANPFHYKRSQRGDTVTDHAAELVLRERGADLTTQLLDFTPYGYDERQFCSPGFDLAVGRLSRGVHGEYPEYHTSLDNLSFITPQALQESVDVIDAIVATIDHNRTYENVSPYGEPQLGRRGLYSAIGGAIGRQSVEMGLLWVLNQSNGTRSLIDIARRSGLPFDAIRQAADALAAASLLREVNAPLTT